MLKNNVLRGLKLVVEGDAYATVDIIKLYRKLSPEPNRFIQLSDSNPLKDLGLLAMYYRKGRYYLADPEYPDYEITSPLSLWKRSKHYYTRISTLLIYVVDEYETILKKDYDLTLDYWPYFVCRKHYELYGPYTPLRIVFKFNSNGWLKDIQVTGLEGSQYEQDTKQPASFISKVKIFLRGLL